MAVLRRRLDVEMVRRGLVESRQAAQRHIEAGDVVVSGAVAQKPGRLVASGEPVSITAPAQQYVSRGGTKLEAALTAFDLDVEGCRAIDVGASTGGFTDCLLQRGAQSVVALDVGRGQIHERLRADPRVRVVERCNIRDLAPERCSDEDRRRIAGEPTTLLVADLSFISLRTAAQGLIALVRQGGSLVVLIKPQFEAGRSVVAKGAGIVSSPDVWQTTLLEVVDHFSNLECSLTGLIPSPIHGTQGNVEFLAHLTRGNSVSDRSSLTRQVNEAVLAASEMAGVAWQ